MSMPDTTRNRLTLGFAGMVIVASLVGALYMMGVADARTLGGGADDAEPLPVVEVTKIVPRQVPILFDVRGFLSGFAEVTVHSEVSGRVVSKPVHDGQQVELGTILCGIDDTFYSLAVQKAEANLGVARGQVREAQSAVAVAEARWNDAQAARDNAQSEFERIRKLYHGKESVEIEYERYETRLKRAEAQLLSAKAACNRAQKTLEVGNAAVGVAEASLAEARETQSRCRIAAPVTGTINQTRYEVGEYVVAGQPLVETIRLDRMKLIVELTGPQVDTLSEKSEAEVTVDAVPSVTFPATFNHVAPKAEPLTRKFRVEFHLDNPNGRLRAGMFARVRIRSTNWTDGIAAPRDAFFRQFGEAFCFVVITEEGVQPVVRLRRVKLLDIPGRIELVRVSEGLAPGDRLVVRRVRSLKDGVAVNISEVQEIPEGDGGIKPRVSEASLSDHAVGPG